MEFQLARNIRIFGTDLVTSRGKMIRMRMILNDDLKAKMRKSVEKS